MRSTLDTIFGSRTRAKILRLLLTNPEKPYFVREIARKVGEHMNSVRRELKILSTEDIVVAQGNLQKRFFQANPKHPLFFELKALVFKGEVMEEQKILKSIQSTGKIVYLALSGFFVNREDLPTDILIVGVVNHKKIERMMRSFQEHFDREIRYTVLSQAEYRYRSTLTDRFLYAILDGPKIEVINTLPTT